MTSQWVGFYSTLRREVYRFWSIKRQTVFGPLLETYLYISIFGAALGARIQSVDGHSYVAFIIPGLLLMAMVMNSFSNNTSSLIQQKMQRSIEDQLTSPISNSALFAAFMLGGFLRGSMVAGLTFITAFVLIDLPVANPLLLIASLTLCGLFFSALGVLIGIRAETFDNISFYQTFVIQPLVFLGGVFYSISLLPEPFKTLTQFDPLFYMINTVRYSMLGKADVDPFLSLSVISAALVALILINLYLFKKGYRLRS